MQCVQRVCSQRSTRHPDESGRGRRTAKPEKWVCGDFLEGEICPDRHRRGKDDDGGDNATAGISVYNAENPDGRCTF